MSKHGLSIGVPCALCLTRITEWLDGDEDTGCPWGGPQGNAQAQPCGHFLEEMWAYWTETLERRVK